MIGFNARKLISGAKGLPAGRQGFTLVELLVVISIIAILAVIGLAVFSGVQKNARDSKRRADIDAIAKAYEAHDTARGYPPLDASYFAGGAIPKDPNGTNYTGYSTASTLTVWTVCASLENTVPTASYCISNRQ